MKRETVGAMAILEVVGGDRGYRISFTCPKNRDEKARGSMEQTEKWSSFWGLFLILGFRISFTCPKNRDEEGVQGTNRNVVVLLGHLLGILGCRILFTCPKNREEKARGSRKQTEKWSSFGDLFLGYPIL